MMQSAESLLRRDATIGFGMSSAVRRFLPEAEMLAVFVVVAKIIREQPLPMAFIEGNDVIQQITPTAFHPTLRNSILPRALERSANAFDFHRSDRGGDLRPILGITIEDDEPRGRPKRKRSLQLLEGLQAGEMPGDVEVQDAPTIVADDEETAEDAESDHRDCEETHCSNGFPVVAQKGKPALGRLGISRRPADPAGDGSPGNTRTQHEEFTVDARGAPGGVLGNHPEDQILNLL